MIGSLGEIPVALSLGEELVISGGSFIVVKFRSVELVIPAKSFD